MLLLEAALSNRQGIMYDKLRALALVAQSGDGTGYWSLRIRPKDDVVRSTMGVDSGPV